VTAPVVSPFRRPLEHLAGSGPDGDEDWRGWQVSRIRGGANNLIYRARRAGGDYAVKFTIRDARDRAGREFASLSALHAAGLNAGPRALLLDRESYAQPVVVLTWLAWIIHERPDRLARRRVWHIRRAKWSL